MNVLMITGDKKFQGSARYALQASAVEKLDVVYWGQGSFWPSIPKNQYDIVTVQDPFWRGLFGSYVARHLGARLNVQVHTDLSAHSLLKRFLAQIVLKHSDSVRVVSEKIKAQVEDIGVRAPIHVLPIFVDIERFRGLRHTASGRPTILWMGRFEPEKGPVAAITTLEHVRATGIDARLIMLGSGSMEGELRGRAEGLPVEFPGWQDPVPYLEGADVVLSTSLHESWGASIVEALAAGVPVVAPDVGVAKEAGATVVPRSELASSVVQILKSGEQGALKLSLPTADEWASKWKESLL
jgi:glycosyltransferase involved in cell wall biosynthesis